MPFQLEKKRRYDLKSFDTFLVSVVVIVIEFSMHKDPIDYDNDNDYGYNYRKDAISIPSGSD